MKNLKRNLMLATSITLLASVVFAVKNTAEITIVNHYNKPLLITKHINPDVLPGLPDQFTLPATGAITSKVIDLGKRSYVRLEDGANIAYWGVKIENGQVNIHDYVRKGIAYSWDVNKIIFCTPDEYKIHKGCV